MWPDTTKGTACLLLKKIRLPYNDTFFRHILLDRITFVIKENLPPIKSNIFPRYSQCEIHTMHRLSKAAHLQALWRLLQCLRRERLIGEHVAHRVCAQIFQPIPCLHLHRSVGARGEQDVDYSSSGGGWKLSSHWPGAQQRHSGTFFLPFFRWWTTNILRYSLYFCISYSSLLHIIILFFSAVGGFLTDSCAL